MSIGYTLNPLIIGLMIPNHVSGFESWKITIQSATSHNLIDIFFCGIQSATEWRRYFFALCAINVWASFIFAIFGSGELQTWAVTDECHGEDEKENSKTDCAETYVSRTEKFWEHFAMCWQNEQINILNVIWFNLKITIRVKWQRFKAHHFLCSLARYWL